MGMQIKGILFDKDGTLIDFYAVWLTAAKEVIPYLAGINGLPQTEEVRQTICLAMGIINDRVMPDGILAWGTYEEIGERVWKALQPYDRSLDCALLQRQISLLFESVCARKDFSYYPVTDLQALFERLAGMGLRLGLATADTRTSTERCLSALQILNCLNYIGCDDGVHRPKPAGDMFEAFAGQCGLKPEEILVAGDSPNDMLFAHRCGGIGVGVLTGVSGKEDFDGKADYVLDSIEGLPTLLENIR